MKITTPLIIITALIANFVIFSCSKDEPGPVDPPIQELTYDVEDLNGNVFVNNQTLEFSVLDYPDASLGFYVRNTSSETIAMRIEVESMTGTDGTLMELCFGECYFGVTAGTSYPTSPSSPNVNIEPGQTQASSGDHFFNMDSGDGNTAVEYSFKFYLADENGDQDGTAFRLKYRYLPN
tara:strand:- start:269 stop:805 length:537 start_codon:yes stop_codon:yes gene_type:complete